MCAESVLGQTTEIYNATGGVIDAITAQPIAGAHFVYGRPATSTDNGSFVSFKIGQTNTAGEFRLQHLKPGIRRIRSAEEWPNPYIVVYSGGFELNLGHGGEAIRKARVAELEEVILSLPLRRWPLGRVIAVTEIALRTPGETLTKQREEVERMLLKHKVRVELWPSG